MIRFVPYSPADIAAIDLQPVQEQFRAQLLRPGYAESLDIRGRAWTALEGDRTVACGGFAPQWEGRSIAWAIVGKDIPKRAWPRIRTKVRTELFREMAKQKAEVGHARVEITVPQDFAAGCRLALLLGFKVEGPLNKYGPDGADHFLLSMVA